MKIKNTITVLLFALILLSSCTAATTAIPTETAVPTPTFTAVAPVGTQPPKPSATAFISSYPPCALPYKSSLPVSAPLSQFDLSNGLTLKEYHSTPNIEEHESGCRYAFRDRAHITEITLSNSYRIVNEPIENLKEKVVVLRNGEEVFETKISQCVYSGLLEAWGYDNHWVIEFVTTDAGCAMVPKSDIIDIVRDGVSLKNENNYKSVFGFQLLAGKPFYFFKKHDNTFGVNYDGNEIELGYDDIPYSDPHPGLDKSIIQYQNIVVFSAEKDGVWSSVVIGVFNK
jgi:hypothetical protein